MATSDDMPKVELSGVDDESIHKIEQSQLNRKFLCNVCNYSTDNSSHFIIHKRIHTGERPFPCPVCPKRFIEKGKLKQHIHIHTGERPYACQECNRKFKDRSTLSKHKKTHVSGAKVYRCCMCSLSFSHPRELKEHTQLHRNDTIFICEVCNKHFTQPSALRAHRRIHDSPRHNKLLKAEIVKAAQADRGELRHSPTLPLDLHVPSQSQGNSGWPIMSGNFSGYNMYGPFVAGNVDSRILSIPDVSRDFSVSRTSLSFDQLDTSTVEGQMINDQLNDPMLTDVKKEPTDLDGDDSSGEPSLDVDQDNELSQSPIMLAETENEREDHANDQDQSGSLESHISYNLEDAHCNDIMDRMNVNVNVMTKPVIDNKQSINFSLSQLLDKPMSACGSRDQLSVNTQMSAHRCSLLDLGNEASPASTPTSVIETRRDFQSYLVTSRKEGMIKASVVDPESQSHGPSPSHDLSPGQGSDDDEDSDLNPPKPDSSTVKRLEDHTNEELLEFMVNRGGFYKCEHCNLYFSNSAMYCLHRGLHGTDNPFKCSICSKNASNMYQFITHCAH